MIKNWSFVIPLWNNLNRGKKDNNHYISPSPSPSPFTQENRGGTGGRGGERKYSPCFVLVISPPRVQTPPPPRFTHSLSSDVPSSPHNNIKLSRGQYVSSRLYRLRKESAPLVTSMQTAMQPNLFSHIFRNPLSRQIRRKMTPVQ